MTLLAYNNATHDPIWDGDMRAYCPVCEEETDGYGFQYLRHGLVWKCDQCGTARSIPREET